MKFPQERLGGLYSSDERIHAPHGRQRGSWRALLGLSVAAIVLVSASCQDIGHKRTNRYSILALAELCSAYTGALRVVTPLRQQGQLTPEQIAQVNATIVATDIACADEPPEDAGGAVVRVSQAINTLLQMAPTPNEEEI